MDVGAERQRAWLKAMGMFDRVADRAARGRRCRIIQPAANWKEIATMTVGFGHGIAVSPLHVVRGTAAVANGGILVRPTILARAARRRSREGVRVMQQSTSDIMRKLMRLVVTDGFGKNGRSAGLLSSAARPAPRRRSARTATRKHTNVSAFISVFPMNAPRYAVYMMLDEPHGNKSTYGFATAGWVAAPAAGRVIARIGADAGPAAGHRRTPPPSTRRCPSRCSPAVRRARRRAARVASGRRRRRAWPAVPAGRRCRPGRRPAGRRRARHGTRQPPARRRCDVPAA